MATTNVTAAQADAGLWNTYGGVWAGNITYSVPGVGAVWSSGYGAGEPTNANHGTLDATQADNFRAVLELWDSYIARSMTEVSDGTPGQIRGAFTDVSARYPNADAFAYGPSTGGVSPEAGDVWIDESEKSTSFARNTQGFELLLHEVGHSLGMKHPFESPTLPAGYDSTTYTVMSYNHQDWFHTWSGSSASFTVRSNPTIAFTPMVLDILAIQGRYGADTATNAGTNVYAFTDASLNGRQAIYDAGGTDTIDLSALSRGSTVDLRPGAYSDLAYYDVEDQIDDLVAQYGNEAFIRQKMTDPNQPAYEWTNNLGLSFSTTIERVIGSSSADDITGNTAANVLNGGGGADILRGLTGNDTYYVDNVGDRVVEASNGGNADQVITSVSYALAAGQWVETLRTTAAPNNIDLAGNDLDNTLIGNGGNNSLNGKAGIDSMTGAGGNDRYLVDNVKDTVFEAADGGVDQVLASVSYRLGSGQSIEKLTTTSTLGTDTLGLTGNDLVQTIQGNAGKNLLDGRGGSDTLYGYGGRDTFLFKSALGNSNVDRIMDFSHADDSIQLSQSIFTVLATGNLASTAFKETSTGTIDSNDRILYNKSTGILSYDADGSGTASKALAFATLTTKPADVSHTDFLVVA